MEMGFRVSTLNSTFISHTLLFLWVPVFGGESRHLTSLDPRSHFHQRLYYVLHLKGPSGQENFMLLSIFSPVQRSEERGSDYSSTTLPPHSPPPLPLGWCHMSFGANSHTFLLLQHSSACGLPTHNSYLAWGGLFIKGQAGRRWTKIA